jgi:membrane fusion protein (multidrug efflux system)
MSLPNTTTDLIRSIILGVVTVLSAIGLFFLLSGSDDAISPKISFRSKVVEATAASPTQIPIQVLVSGRLESVNRLELYSEVTGILQTNNFRAGQRFAAGQTIAAMDDSEYRAQLTALRSSFMALVSQTLPDLSLDYPTAFPAWKAFLRDINPKSSLPALPSLADEQIKQFISGRNILANYYSIQSQEVRLRKHRITAPYSGVLSEASIDPGTLVRVGQKLGTFVSQGSYELEAPLAKNDLKHLRVGSKVKLNSTELDKEFIGTVSRINNIINPTTQMVSVFLKVSGQGLKEGLYLKAVIDGGYESRALIIDRNILIDGNAIYTIAADSTLHLTPVEVVSFVEEKAIIKGVSDGTLLPLSAISGAFEGMKVEPLVK